MAQDTRWRRHGHARGRYAPRLWPVWLVAPIWVAAASALALVIYLLLRAVAVPRPGPNGGPGSIDPLDVIKTTITVAGFVGAVLVGVYGYRKQRLVEGDAHRADAEQLAQRYTTAASQLGHEKAAVRLAGVYAMARLADDWDEQRQVCIDVLCAYLRMPYEPDTASAKHREGEREVRLTIIRIIRDHLQDPTDPTAWCDLDFDFTNTIFDGGDFAYAKFTESMVFFTDAEFAAGETFFDDAVFAGGSVVFSRAKFSGGNVYFDGTKFAGGSVDFSDGKFADGEIFFGARFVGGKISFAGTEFAGGEVSFDGAKFTRSKVSFDGAKFSGGNVNFSNGKFTGGSVSFDHAEYTGGSVSFDTAEFPGCIITWGPFEPPAAWTELQEKERRQNEQPP